METKSVSINITFKGDKKIFSDPEFKELVNYIKRGQFQKDLQKDFNLDKSSKDKFKIITTIDGI